MAVRMGVWSTGAFAAMLVAAGACGGASAKAEVSGNASGDGEVNASASVGAGSERGDSADPATQEGWQSSDGAHASGPMPEAVDGTDPVPEDPDLPQAETLPVVATLPAFQQLRSDRSVVLLRLTGRVPITETRTGGRLVYRMPGVRVPARTNQFDLPTSYFPTTVGRIHLVQVGDGAELIVETRARVRPLARVQRSGSGVELRLEFPRLAEVRAQEQAAAATSPE